VEWVNVAWGVGVPAIVFILLWSLEVITDKRKIAYFFVWALFMAGYFVWRADHLRLKQKISIANVLSHSWPIDSANLATLFSLEIVNSSEGLTIYDVRVQLKQIVPRVQGIDWLPVALIHKHDTPIRPQDYKLSFDLHPGAPKHIDFIRAIAGADHFDIYHVVDAQRSIPAAPLIDLRLW
jgi:hypothetical protein